jgi:hypothetical protein
LIETVLPSAPVQMCNSSTIGAPSANATSLSAITAASDGVSTKTLPGTRNVPFASAGLNEASAIFMPAFVSGFFGVMINA